jgi:hypothetical protein
VNLGHGFREFALKVRLRRQLMKIPGWGMNRVNDISNEVLNTDLKPLLGFGEPVSTHFTQLRN